MIARGHFIARVARTLAIHGVLAYLSQSYLLFFIVGSRDEVRAQLSDWGVRIPDREILFLDSSVAEAILATGSEQETLANAELQRLLRVAMTSIRANNLFAKVARQLDTLGAGNSPT